MNENCESCATVKVSVGSNPWLATLQWESVDPCHVSPSLFDTLVCALDKRRTHNRAVGMVMDKRHIGPAAADRHLRERAVSRRLPRDRSSPRCSRARAEARPWRDHRLTRCPNCGAAPRATLQHPRGPRPRLLGRAAQTLTHGTTQDRSGHANRPGATGPATMSSDPRTKPVPSGRRGRATLRRARKAGRWLGLERPGSWD